MIPKYLVLMEQLTADIENGVYEDGEKLPAENELAKTSNISRQTVRQALSLLERKGLIEKHHGSGSFVKIPRASRDRTGNIAVITTYIGEYIFPDMLRGIDSVLSANGVSPMLFATYNRIDNEQRILMDLARKNVDGLIVEGTKTALPNPNIHHYRDLLNSGLPIVFIHGFYPELSQCVHVVADDHAGGMQAVKYLHSKGRKNICGIFKSDDMQGVYRYSGFVEQLQKLKLRINDDRILWYSTESREQTIASGFLHIIDGCDALVCYNDEVALQAIELLANNNIQIPKEVAVISFDNSSYSELAPIKITSYANDEFLLGQLAATKLMSLLEGAKEASVVSPWKIVEKDST